MNELDLKEVWNEYQVKIDSSMEMHKKNEYDISKLKSQNLINSMKPITIFAILIGLIWVISIGTIAVNLMLYHFQTVSKFFLFSMIGQLIITIIAIAIYLFKMIGIHNVDFSEPILTSQKKLAQLLSSTLWVTRILFLQLPLWTTFYLSIHMLKNAHPILLIVQAIGTLSFSFIAAWLFFNIKMENKDKKWFKLIFGGKEWNPILKSMQMLEDIKKY
ncbi:MAG: hypothetical protein RLZZ546_1000 [Bacteroidota bacterium]|jgi:hypothetical protein